jgi:hypothetical protein
MKMSQLVEQDQEGPRKPPKFVVLPPSLFSDEWEAKPTVDVAIGLRLISFQATDEARKEAERAAVGFYAELRGLPLPSDPRVALDVHNDALMVKAVARCMCDPNDVTAPYWRCSEDMVRMALTAEGVRRLYDELVILHATMSPGRRAADDDEVEQLARVLASGPVLEDEDRKLISYLLGRLDAGGVVEDRGDDDASTSSTSDAGQPRVLAVGHS